MADQDQVAHLLRRTETVVRPARLAALGAMTLDEAIDDVFDFAQNPPAVLPLAIRSNPERWESKDLALQWWVDRMATVPRPLQEKLTMFWHGHFVVSWEKVNEVMPVLDQVQLYRDHAAGDLHELTQAMAVMPAMLFYLDNLDNSKWSPNQNFARELMELFTLGVGNYTEGDVEASSAAWTGHSIDWDAANNGVYRYRFYPEDHDDGLKTFFGTEKAWDGPQIISEILRDNPQKRLVAARFITKKLWEFFAAPVTPAGSAEATPVVELLAQVLVDNDMVVAPMLKAMFGRTTPGLTPQQTAQITAAFYGSTVRHGLVRTPTDFAVALVHHTGVSAVDWLSSWDMEGTGQVPFWPPNVSGWRSNGYWVNTTAFSARAQMVASLCWGTFGDDVRAFADAHTPTELYDHLAAIFYRDPATEITTATRDAILAYLQSSEDDWWQPIYAVGLFALAPEFHLA